MKKKAFALVMGLLFLLAFAAYVAQRILHIPIFSDTAGWWTVFIIVPALIGLTKRGSRIFSFGTLLVGCGLLVREQGWFDGILSGISFWEMAIAALLLVIGLSIISGVFSHKKRPARAEVGGNCKCGDNGNGTAVFSDRFIDYSGLEFDGIELNGVFGDVTLDLRSAIINRDSKIEANSVFGSITILACDYANFKIDGSTVFGEVKDKTKHSETADLPEILINATSVFGSVEIV